MNVSPEADMDFMCRLRTTDPTRYKRLMREIRRDTAGMGEGQALTNYVLGLRTGQYRFEVIAGKPAPLPVEVKPKARSVRKRFRSAIARRGGPV
jgi:hypothetical protein